MTSSTDMQTTPASGLVLDPKDFLFSQAMREVASCLAADPGFCLWIAGRYAMIAAWKGWFPNLVFLYGGCIILSRGPEWPGSAKARPDAAGNRHWMPFTTGAGAEEASMKDGFAYRQPAATPWREGLSPERPYLDIDAIGGGVTTCHQLQAPAEVSATPPRKTWSVPDRGLTVTLKALPVRDHVDGGRSGLHQVSDAAQHSHQPTRCHNDSTGRGLTTFQEGVVAHLQLKAAAEGDATPPKKTWSIPYGHLPVTSIAPQVRDYVDGGWLGLRQAWHAGQYSHRGTQRQNDLTGSGFTAFPSHVAQVVGDSYTAGLVATGLAPLDRAEYVSPVEVARDRGGQRTGLEDRFAPPAGASHASRARYSPVSLNKPELHHVRMAELMAKAPHVLREHGPSSRELTGIGKCPTRLMALEPETPTKANGRSATEYTLSHLADRVYQILEHKIQIELERKGLHG